MSSDDQALDEETAKIESIIKKFVEKHNTDLLDLQKCKQIKANHEKKLKEIQNELNLENPSSSFAQTIEELNCWVTKADSIVQDRTEPHIADIDKHVNENDEILSKLQDYNRQLDALELTLQYIEVIKSVETLSNDLEKALKLKDDEESVTIFANLSEVTRQLATSPAKHLLDYLKELTFYWHNYLKQKFSQEFNDTLKTIKWPIGNAVLNVEVISELNMNRLQILVEYLLQIDMPDELVTKNCEDINFAEFSRLCLPVKLMIEPIKKRFMFHFYGNRKTNRSDKPEWYFTKILTWIREHADHVEKWIQPVADKMGFYFVDAKTEFMRGLVQLAVKKLHSELPSLQFDDFTFSHCIDEALGFDKELKDTYFYPATQPSILVVLTQAQVFMKWLSMEKKYALEKMDAMLSESQSDAFHPVDSEVEDLKIAPFAEIFITLLQTITERYEMLPQPGHRLQFLDLQLELLDDFRVRLLQLINAEEIEVMESKVPIIANTLFYIENVLVDWGAMLHFLSLYYYKSQYENGVNSIKNLGVNVSHSEIDSDNVFAETLSLYKHMRSELLNKLTKSVIAKVKSNSRGYINEMWFQMKTVKDTRSQSLTPTACRIFEILATKLYQLQKSLTNKLFGIVWRSIAEAIDEFFFKKLVYENRFSEGGALQLKFDVTRNLYPLFSQYTEKPDCYFVRLNESCCLLNISKGSALLLKETLVMFEGATGIEDRRGPALNEIGVYHFGPKESLEILNRRADITVNRLSLD